MSTLPAAVLEAVVAASTDAVLVMQSGHPDWPVCLANDAFARMADEVTLEGPFADVCEALFGREIALDLSEAIRTGEATRFPVQISGRDCLLSLAPLGGDGDSDSGYAAVFLRDVSGGAISKGDVDTTQALLKAKKRIRDLDRDDPVTGLLNERAFRDVLSHDWAVAAREHSRLALVRFELVDFDAYVHVFGKHASDSCQRRVGQAIRRCLRRASDVVARFDDTSFVVLSHTSDEAAVERFAASIAEAVRELGLHHPRSRQDKFVTVEYQVEAAEATGKGSADEFLARIG